MKYILLSGGGEELLVKEWEKILNIVYVLY